jgi:ribosome-associated protein
VSTDDAENPEHTDAATPAKHSEASAGKPLRLDQFLKLCGVAGTGGQAKQLIQGGEVTLNGQIETRRRKKLVIDDVIEVFDSVLPVADFFSAE